VSGALLPIPMTLIILAAQRTGIVNPLAEAHGVSHKCLVPICGKPLISHVLDTANAMDDVGLIRISVEADTHAALEPLLQPYRAASGKTIDLVSSQPGIADSVLGAIAGQAGPFVITTADNVLVTPAAIRAIGHMLGHADITAGLASEAAIKAAHPEGQRRFYTFADGGYSNCNIYGIAGDKGIAAVEIFREGGQFMNNPKRLINAFGLINILMMKWGWISLSKAFVRISKRFKLVAKEVVFADGALAIDVDNERTYAIAESILAKRLGL
jgi:GTP:adenosylcobinamide-phosphate guanylyltransferase